MYAHYADRRVFTGYCAHLRLIFSGGYYEELALQRDLSGASLGAVALCQFTGRAKGNIQATGARPLWPKPWICRRGIGCRGLEFCIFRSLRE